MNSARPSLRHGLLVHLWGPLLVILALGAFGAIAVARYVGNLVHDQWLLDSAMTLAAQVKARDGKPAIELPRPALEMFEWDRVDRIYEEVSSARSGVLLGNTAFPMPPAEAAQGEPFFYDTSIEGAPVRAVSVTLRHPGGLDDTIRIQVGETTRKRELVANRIVQVLAPLQATLLVLAGAVIWIAVTRNLRKIDEIAGRLRGYEPERFGPVADSSSVPSEIEPLVSAINQLLGKLDAAQEAQRRFVANAAHQLRTPLAALQVQTQRALRERDPAKQSDALADVLRAVTRLHHVAHQLLMLMRTEAVMEQAVKLAPTDLAAVAREAVERWTDAAVARRMDLGYEGPDGEVMVQGEPHLLREMVDNLLDNAIRYGHAGGAITLALATDPLRITVEDDGPGIAESERARVLERFYRGAGSETAGCGLGLPIASEIAALHGAHLRLDNPPEETGTRVVVQFAP